MGLLDWLFRRKAEPVAETPPPVVAAPVAKKTVAAPKAPKPPKPKKAHKGKKRNKVVASPVAPKGEVLSVAEAERRYGAMFREPPPVAEVREPEPEPEPVPIPLPIQRPIQSTRPPSPPREPRPPRPPSVEDEREATRAWAIVPQLEALLVRADKATAEAATSADLRAMRRKLEIEWEELGRPPRDRVADLEAQKKLRLDAVAARLRTFAEADDKEMDALVEARKALLERAGAAVEVQDLKQAREQLKGIEVEWRAAPKLDARRFHPLKAAWDAKWQVLNARSDAARAEGEQLRAGRLEQQRQLALRAEALAKATDTRQAAEQMKGLQAQWKGVGFAGRTEETEALWARFRTAADQVFAHRNEADDTEGRANAERKEALIAKALELAEEGVADPEHALDDLHRSWKKIGQVSRRESDELWTRFRAACDRVRKPPPVAPEALGDGDALRYNPFSGLARKGDR